mmetsp:Transcript_90390/g.286412  ORF Transcript_90390/g.286412 Transcript_90390/m.286412 type:complete len:242 (+) Transcript_90390:115-840(+)
MMQTGPHIAICEGFFQRCLETQVAAPSEAWSTGGVSFRNVLDCSGGSGATHTTAPTVSWHLLPHRPDGSEARPSAGAMQVQNHDIAGHDGIQFGNYSVVLCLGVDLADTTLRTGEGSEQVAGGTAAQRAAEAGSQEGGSGTGAAPGQRRRTMPRRPRRRALNLVKSHSCVAALERGAKEVCPICLDVPTPGQMVRTLPCFHMMHDACSIRYFRTRGVAPTCPVCRCDFAHALEGEEKEDTP